MLTVVISFMIFVTVHFFTVFYFKLPFDSLRNLLFYFSWCVIVVILAFVGAVVHGFREPINLAEMPISGIAVGGCVAMVVVFLVIFFTFVVKTFKDEL